MTLPEIVHISNLRDRDLRKEGIFVAEGRLLVERVLAAPFRVLCVCADRSAADEALALAKGRVSVTVCSDSELSQIAGFPFHRGIFALAERPPMKDASSIMRTAAWNSSAHNVLVLPAITDPGNLGTLLRSALAFGYDAAFLGPQSCDPFNRKALRSSMGASLALSIYSAEPADLNPFTARGVPVFAAAMEDEALIAGRVDSETFRRNGHALVLGNEYGGIPPEWRARCSLAVRIPSNVAVDSLNVAVAGAILMWEAVR